MRGAATPESPAVKEGEEGLDEDSLKARLRAMETELAALALTIHQVAKGGSQSCEPAAVVTSKERCVRCGNSFSVLVRTCFGEAA